ncbi:HipA family kinase [Caldalkalibacillus mannanilyticus]|uniref:HipA family kinase n=1 Tax=Caldalkalibacillus mannanilyticus TaxID=1418 RepID=UPI00046AC00D|nr:HipA family kinase [Caldalkalibacillus mannanilyticus]
MLNQWKLVKHLSSREKLGSVWFASQLTSKKKKKQGYFKYTTPQNEQFCGPLIANEYIAYRLGKKINLPMASVKKVRIKGKAGIISLEKKQTPLYNWAQLSKQHPNIFDHLHRPKRLLKMFVFDVWIANIDRNNRNIILYPTNKGYDFYLIDHGLSLLGAIRWKKVRWNKKYWNSVSEYNRRYLKGLPAISSKIRSIFQLILTVFNPSQMIQ